VGVTPRRRRAGRFCHAAAKTVAAPRRSPLCHGAPRRGGAILRMSSWYDEN